MTRRDLKPLTIPSRRRSPHAAIRNSLDFLATAPCSFHPSMGRRKRPPRRGHQGNDASAVLKNVFIAFSPSGTATMPTLSSGRRSDAEAAIAGSNSSRLCLRRRPP